jgi:cation diffusion facilitator family transporter
MGLTYSFYIKFGLFLEVLSFLVKVGAAFSVSSAALYSETLHSLADLMDSIFVYVGMRLSQKPPDPAHPFGYGKEKFFWALITALFMSSITAALSISKGVGQILNPHPLRHAELGLWAMYISFTLSMVTLVMGLYLIFKGREIKFAGFRGYRDPSVKVKVAEDVASVTGNLLAFIAIFIFSFTGKTLPDALVAIVVGVMLAFMGFVLAAENKDLIIGRSATRLQRKTIVDAALSVKEVVRVMDLKTMLMGPEEILVNIEVNLVDGLDTDTVEKVTDEIRARIEKAVPHARQIQIEVESQ